MKTSIDDAIDRVAARMTAVEEDEALALRIVSSLPARSGWSLHWLMPRLAVGTLAALTLAVVLKPFDERSAIVLRTENTSAVVEPGSTVDPPSNDRRTSVEPPVIVRRTTVEPPSNVRRTEEDHEFSLAAIASPEALSVGVLDPVDLPADDALAMAPLVIAELPLSADFSPR